jgi:hypothetical protein
MGLGNFCTGDRGAGAGSGGDEEDCDGVTAQMNLWRRQRRRFVNTFQFAKI